MKKLKPGFKIFLIIVLMIGIFFGVKTFIPSDENSSSSTFGGIFSSTPTVTIGVNTYAGFTPIIWLNGGLKPNEDSYITKNYGIKLNIVIQDDFIAGRNAFINGDINMIYCTTDVLATEMGESSSMKDAKYIMMLNRSQGSDAMVVNKNIRTVADLKGKKIAVAEGTASHTLLINILETNNISPNEVNLVKVEHGGAAAETFKAGQVDACVTWSPDDASCVEAVKGSRILVSTKHAKDLITDGLICSEKYIDNNKEIVKKVIKAILYANSVINSQGPELAEAAKYFANAFGTDEDFCIEGCKNIWFATLADQSNFFGFNSEYQGVKAEEIYSKMARIYTNLGLAKSPMSWRKVASISLMEEIVSEGNIGNNQDAQPSTTFTPVTEEIVKKEAISNKKLTINFPTGEANLDNDSRTLIDREFVSIAKQFNNARIRVEGNTDNTGNPSINEKLSYLRAMSVVNYLCNEYGFDKNRFIIIGNGSKHAIRDNVQGANVNYRTTDFMLVTE